MTCIAQIEEMETRAAGLGESNRAKADAEEFQLIVTQFLRENAGISDDAPVVRDFLFQNTHTVSGLGGGGRSAGDGGGAGFVGPAGAPGV